MDTVTVTVYLISHCSYRDLCYQSYTYVINSCKSSILCHVSCSNVKMYRINWICQSFHTGEIEFLWQRAVKKLSNQINVGCWFYYDLSSIIHSWIGEASTLEPIEGFNLTSFGQLLSGCSDCWFHNQARLGGWWLISPAEVFISVKLGTKFSPLMASWKENNPNINYLTKLKLRFD